MRQDSRLTVDDVLIGLAQAAAAGPWEPTAIHARWRAALRQRKALPWGPQVATVLVASHAATPGKREIVLILGQSAELLRWLRRRGSRLRFDVRAAGPPVMLPLRGGFRAWALPEITTPGQLADWLKLSIPELDWFADIHSWERRRTSTSLQHYRYRWLMRGGRRPRPVESPKPRLKAIQRQILREILDRVPVHRAAHGFRRERSIATFAAPHAGQVVVWKLDLRDFFARIRRPRIAAVFRAFGYPDEVLPYLTGLLTNVVPESAMDEVRSAVSDNQFQIWRHLLTTPHLPQGAPTSPALANLVTYNLDARLTGLARTAGANYTRYADDLAFSGDRRFGESLPRFRQLALAIILDEGFEIRDRKSRVMWRNQQQRVAGLVVNHTPRPARDEYDRLKAILHNCRRFGPESQNREGVPDFRAHLLGRISYLNQFDPGRGERLRQNFDAVLWRDS